MMQVYMSLKNSSMLRERIDLWLSMALDTRLRRDANGGQASKGLEDILSPVLDWVKYTKVGIASCIFLPKC